VILSINIQPKNLAIRIKAGFSFVFEIKVSYKDIFSTFGAKMFTCKSGKVDIFPEDINLGIFKKQLAQIFGYQLYLVLNSIKHFGVFTVMDAETT